MFFLFFLMNSLIASFYASSKTSFRHIITMNIEIRNNNLFIKKKICFKCYKNKTNTDLEKKFKSIKCSNVKYDGKKYTAYCDTHFLGNGFLYQKSIKGNTEEAKISGISQYELDPDYGIGVTTFIFLNESEYLLYKKYLENNTFITSEEFKQKLE